MKSNYEKFLEDVPLSVLQRILRSTNLGPLLYAKTISFPTWLRIRANNHGLGMHILPMTEFKFLEPGFHLNLSFFRARQNDIKYLQSLINSFSYAHAVTFNSSMREGKEKINIKILKYFEAICLDFELAMDCSGLKHPNVSVLIINGRERESKVVELGNLKKSFPMLDDIRIDMYNPTTSLINELKAISLRKLTLNGAKGIDSVPKDFFANKREIILHNCNNKLVTQFLIEVKEGLETCNLQIDEVPGVLFTNLARITTLTAVNLIFHIASVESYESLLNVYYLAAEKEACQWTIAVTVTEDPWTDYNQTPYETLEGFQAHVRMLISNVNQIFPNILRKVTHRNGKSHNNRKSYYRSKQTTPLQTKTYLLENKNDSSYFPGGGIAPKISKHSYTTTVPFFI